MSRNAHLQREQLPEQWTRAFTSATLIGGGAIGGIIGTSLFRAKDSPDYRPGILTCLLANALMIAIIGVLTLRFMGENKKARNEGRLTRGWRDSCILINTCVTTWVRDFRGSVMLFIGARVHVLVSNQR